MGAALGASRLGEWSSEGLAGRWGWGVGVSGLSVSRPAPCLRGAPESLPTAPLPRFPRERMGRVRNPAKIAKMAAPLLPAGEGNLGTQELKT